MPLQRITRDIALEFDRLEARLGDGERVVERGRQVHPQAPADAA